MKKAEGIKKAIDIKSMSYGHEGLEVWQKSVDFSVAVIKEIEALDTRRNHYRLLEQVEACVASIAANIAEGKGRFSKKEFTHFLYIARGSLYETLTFLEIFRRLEWISNDIAKKFDVQGKEIAAMLKGLINAIQKES